MAERYDIEFFDTIDSTNNEAKRRILAAQEEISRPFVIVSHSQTAGRGRQGKSFFSPEDTGIYMSVACPMNCPVQDQVTITSRTAVAVSRAIESFFGVECAIKWVNDIYVNDRKCCGILCEAVNDYEKDLLRFVVIGAGVNISTSEWPDEIAQTAGSLRREAVTEEEFRAFAGRMTEEILNVIYDPDGSEMEYYRAHSWVIGREITFTGKINCNQAQDPGTDMKPDALTEGKAVGIDDNGGLIVEMPSGERITLDSGEITVRIAKRTER
ncbi:MAG: biotin--[acetyl-CoA-carboxylase] ligase [Lachnospiraceae bacterium]|nr:biotin--[acetyl-CoA-carboxylase] ligase [Lachnospiraceae bacterium]